MAAETRNSQAAYLRALWQLSYPAGDPMTARSGPQPTAPARIAELLDVSRASVGEMLGRLEARGLVTRGAHKEALLTGAGRIEAMRLVRRLRIAERLAADVLEYPVAECFDQAVQVADAFSDEAVERLFLRLGQPDRCPHGVPVDPDHELRESPTLVALTDLEPGIDAIVVRAGSERAGTPAGSVRGDLLPGIGVQVLEADGHVIRLSVAGIELPPAAREQLDRIYVRPHDVPEVPAQAACWAHDRMDTPSASETL